MAGYIGVLHPVADASLSAIIAIYLSGALWIGGLVVRYFTRRRMVAYIESDIKHHDSTEIRIHHKKPLSLFPGCYFYLSYPSNFGFKSLHFSMFVNSLALTPTRDPGNNDGQISFVLSHRDSKARLLRFPVGQQILLDGPYGQDIDATACTTMVLVAQGAGIVGVLAFVCRQVERFKSKSDRKEKLRVDVLWVLDHYIQQDLVGSQLRELQELDHCSNTVVWLLYPPHTNDAAIKLPFKANDNYWAWYKTDDYLAYLRSLMQDCPSENCIVIACGDPKFSATVRREIAAKVEPALRFAEVSYRPRQPSIRRPSDEEADLASDRRSALTHTKRNPTANGSKHRLAAAKKVFGKQYFWTVRLYCPRDKNDPLMRIQTQGFFHQTPLSDGEIYWLLRCYNYRCGQDTDPPWTQLSPSKEKNLHMLTRITTDRGITLYKHQGILYALDSVISLFALRNGLRLGNWHKILRLRCPEPVIHYLNRMRRQWIAIAQNVPGFCAEPSDIQILEFLAPSIPGDRSKIRHLMQENLLFPTITDRASREVTLQNILSVEGIITSMKTFHTNMNYFEIAVDVLRQHIMQEGEEAKHSTLFQNLSAHWDHTKAVVEYKEGHFRQLTTTNFKTAVVQLFLFVLRHFPYLSNAQPLQDGRGVRAVAAAADEYFLYRLYTLASRLGFSTTKIRQGIRKRKSQYWPRRYVVNEHHRRWRGGKPPMRAFLDLETQAFLPAITQAEIDKDTPLFVQADFISAFFGKVVYHLEEEILSDHDSPPPSSNNSWYTGVTDQSWSPTNASKHQEERISSKAQERYQDEVSYPDLRNISNGQDLVSYPTLPDVTDCQTSVLGFKGDQNQGPYSPPHPIPGRSLLQDPGSQKKSNSARQSLGHLSTTHPAHSLFITNGHDAPLITVPFPLPPTAPILPPGTTSTSSIITTPPPTTAPIPPSNITSTPPRPPTAPILPPGTTSTSSIITTPPPTTAPIPPSNITSTPPRPPTAPILPPGATSTSSIITTPPPTAAPVPPNPTASIAPSTVSPTHSATTTPAQPIGFIRNHPNAPDHASCSPRPATSPSVVVDPHPLSTLARPSRNPAPEYISPRISAPTRPPIPPLSGAMADSPSNSSSSSTYSISHQSSHDDGIQTRPEIRNAPRFRTRVPPTVPSKRPSPEVEERDDRRTRPHYNEQPPTGPPRPPELNAVSANSSKTPHNQALGNPLLSGLPSAGPAAQMIPDFSDGRPSGVSNTGTHNAGMTQGRNLTARRMSKTGSTHTADIERGRSQGSYRRKNWYMQKQKLSWQRHFQQGAENTSPTSRDAFLAEQGQLFDDFYAKQQRTPSKDAFLEEQQAVFEQFRNFRPTEPHEGHDIELPDRPNSAEEFMSCQEELYQRYPGRHPKLLPTHSSSSSGSSAAPPKEHQTPINPWEYRESQQF
ncbi:uncharacterized protein E0L32_007819 [Thyridium curvatum]|uniref:FAD-binding FR-type domain-containing protein n=1 Tax=Thyridium curvatum TaxID=1093900 RepID=A0A507B470_9PEZI|nr:uncharacterized protein E0L32_007819 [Thyridium curvatum]TPX11400.1 hypothetical protein E0L32_007819 [Thyridium curvatum]